MFLKKVIKRSTKNSLSRVNEALADADAILIGIGAGMSAAAGLEYFGPRFEKYFADFKDKYGIADMYSGGFYPFKTKEEYWAWWSRHVYINRYLPKALQPYLDLLKLVNDKNYFILTTNVDHQIQKAGFDKTRLFYTQGDYGLFQCSVPCHAKTYNNETIIKKMVEQQSNMRIPTELIPKCPRCGENMTMNLRIDDRFVENEGWHKAQARYEKFLAENAKKNIVYLELGVGMNTPGIIKYPFLQMTNQNPKAEFISFNAQRFEYPEQLEPQIIQVVGDIAEELHELVKYQK